MTNLFIIETHLMNLHGDVECCYVHGIYSKCHCAFAGSSLRGFKIFLGMSSEHLSRGDLKLSPVNKIDKIIHSINNAK